MTYQQVLTTRRVPHVKQELPILPDHLISSPVLVGFMLHDHLFYMQYFIDHCFFFCLFLPVIAVFVLTYTAPD
jgi:hypothetical protein